MLFQNIGTEWNGHQYQDQKGRADCCYLHLGRGRFFVSTGLVTLSLQAVSLVTAAISKIGDVRETRTILTQHEAESSSVRVMVDVSSYLVVWSRTIGQWVLLRNRQHCKPWNLETCGNLLYFYWMKLGLAV